MNVAAVRTLGVVDLPLLQRKANFHISVTRDLFGSEISSNAAEAFSSGLKGRFNEANLTDDHVLQDATYAVTRVIDGKLVPEQVPALRAINARLLDDYIADCQGGIDRWNRTSRRPESTSSSPNRIRVQPADRRVRRPPHQPRRRVLTEERSGMPGRANGCPTTTTCNSSASLMKPCHERGKYASWIAPPRVGINNQPGDFEYVKIY